MKIAVVGQGYVGLTIAVESAKVGHHVVGFDVSQSLVQQLSSGISHIEGISTADLSELISNHRYRATTDGEGLAGAEVIVIAVPTPLDTNRNPDLTFVRAACASIIEHVKSPSLIINESTSYPGTLRKEIAEMIGAQSKVEHLYAASPERVDPGNAVWGSKNTPRLISGLTPEATVKAHDFYQSFCENLVIVSTPEVAEAAKLFENTFRQVNIALVNEFAQITHAMGIPTREVLHAAATKPYGFMEFTPGPGVGGHCIPVDPSYLAYAADEVGIAATFIRRANDVNLEMPTYVVERVKSDNGGSLSGKKVVVVGIAYKPNVADTRESPAELVIQSLARAGAIVSWHDPVVKKWHAEESAPLGAGAFDIAIVVTRHSSVSSQDIKKSAGYIFDCTGTLEDVAGI